VIVTLSLNPALDKSAYVDQFLPGRVNRLRDITMDAGGKGVNVSRMILALDGQSAAVGFAGGPAGELFLKKLIEQGLTCDFVTTQAVTRENIKIRDSSGVVTELNEPGQPISAHEMELLIAKLLYRGGKGSYFVLAGALPCGSEPDTYRTIIKRIKNTKGYVLFDAQGEALQEGINAGVDLLKLNRQEFCGLLRKKEASERIIYNAAKELCTRGMEIVIVTLGSGGAVFVTRNESYRVTPPTVEVKSGVGAGDCMMGALAYGLERGMSFSSIVRMSSAASVGAVMMPGTAAPDRALMEEIAAKLVIRKAVS